MLQGGIERGTITLISGPPGVGKSSLAIQFMKEAASRDERSAAFIFEENRETLVQRCRATNIPVDAMLDRGTLNIIPVEALHYSADHLASVVRQEVEVKGARVVLIDSISGYRLSVRGEDLIGRLHALSKYLQNMGVTLILVNETEMVTGDFRATEVGISYLADNIVFLRYVEVNGRLKNVIGVLKKRLTSFERYMREMEITDDGIKVGRPVTGLRGVLKGTPEIERGSVEEPA
jgi:circadian clock protein KaiC